MNTFTLLTQEKDLRINKQLITVKEMKALNARIVESIKHHIQNNDFLQALAEKFNISEDQYNVVVKIKVTDTIQLYGKGPFEQVNEVLEDLNVNEAIELLFRSNYDISESLYTNLITNNNKNVISALLGLIHDNVNLDDSYLVKSLDRDDEMRGVSNEELEEQDVPELTDKQTAALDDLVEVLGIDGKENLMSYDLDSHTLTVTPALDELEIASMAELYHILGEFYKFDINRVVKDMKELFEN